MDFPHVALPDKPQLPKINPASGQHRGIDSWGMHLAPRHGGVKLGLSSLSILSPLSPLYLCLWPPSSVLFASLEIYKQQLFD